MQAHQSDFTQRDPKKQWRIHLKCMGKVKGIIHDPGAVHKDGRRMQRCGKQRERESHGNCGSNRRATYPSRAFLTDLPERKT